MGSIRIEISGQTTTYDEPRVLRIGREPGCEVMADGATVSRHHAELRPAGDGWEVVDVGSTHGTWVNGQRVERQVLPAGTTLVRFGLTEGGATAQVTVEGAVAADRPAAGATAAMPPPALAATVLPNTPAAPGAPGGGPGLLVRTRGQDLRFGTQAAVRIGREPGLEVTVDDAGVSRHHALVEPRPDGWWYVDRSNSGSFVDGERVTQRKLEEPVTVFLGHPTAGYEIELVPIVAAGQVTAAIARKRRRKTLAVVAAAVAVVVVVGGGVAAAVLLSDDDSSPSVNGKGGDQGLTEAELDRAKQASVFLTAVGADGAPTHTGSGSIVSEDGLILTNAHVAKPSAPGLGGSELDDPEYLLVSLTSGSDDTPAEATYRAEPVVADGVLDFAVLRITADEEGTPVEPDGMELPEPMPLGDSDELRTGDEITALGFPAIASLDLDDPLARALTVTRGVVSTFKRDAVIDSNRASIDSDIRIGSGNSGGASINDDGELVGVNTAVITNQTTDQGGAFTGGSALIRPVNLAEEVLTIAEEGGDPEYVSPYFESMPTPPDDLPVGAEVVSGGWTGDGQGRCSGSSTPDAPQQYAVPEAGQVIFAEFSVTGLEDGTPVSFDFYDLAGDSVLTSLPQVWDFGTEEVCIFVPFEVPEGATGANAVFAVDEQVLAQNPVVFVQP